jgi:hypothetical protein
MASIMLVMLSISKDMSMTLPELLYCCTSSSARLAGQVEKNIQLFLALKCQMESIVGAKSIWLKSYLLLLDCKSANKIQ